ncbi:MAG: tetratricopeptide repeat protein [Verrucomicrobia bacterium]|nr:tetratricopeptide repeat protein [Verrucomicrobiota bacterium]
MPDKEKPVRIFLAFAVFVLGTSALTAAESVETFAEAMQRVTDALSVSDCDKALEGLRDALPLAETPEQRFGVCEVTGLMLSGKGRYAEAREAFRKALGIADLDLDSRLKAYSYLAETWEEEGKHAEARAIYSQALHESHPTWRCSLLSAIAFTWREEGEYEKAKEVYAELLKLAKTQHASRWVAITHRSIGHVLAEQEEFAAALEAYEQAARVDVTGEFRPSLCLAVGRALIGLKRYADAKLVLSAVIEDELVPIRNSAWMLIADALEGEGKVAEATRLRETTPQGKPPEFDPTAHFAYMEKCRAVLFLTIGNFYLDQGAKDKAYRALIETADRDSAPLGYRQKAYAYLDYLDAMD